VGFQIEDFRLKIEELTLRIEDFRLKISKLNRDRICFQIFNLQSSI